MAKAKTEKSEVKGTKEVSEIEEKIVELAKKGMTSEKIGEALRQQRIHPREYEKISKILKEKNLYHSPEIKNIQKKLDRVTAHKDKHIQDKRAMRERERIFSLLRKQKEYHKLI